MTWHLIEGIEDLRVRDTRVFLQLCDQLLPHSFMFKCIAHGGQK